MIDTILAADNGSLRPGVIASANAARYDTANLSTPLTAYAVGFMNTLKVRDELNFIAPVVPTARRFSFRKIGENQAFISEDDDIRAVNAKFKTVEFTGEEIDSKTINKGLAVVIDEDDRQISDEQTVAYLLRRLFTNEQRRAISVLDSIDSSAAVVWNPASPTNAISDLRNMVDASHLASGIYPNRMILGSQANTYLFSVLQAKDGPVANVTNLKQVTEHLMLEEARMISNVYATKKGTGNKTAILGNVIYCYYAADGLTPEDPSAIKRFVSPTSAGGDYAVYIEKSTKFTTITVEHYSRVIATGSLGVQKRTVTQS